MEDNEDESGENASILAQEISEVKRQFNLNWSWHKLVKDVADYTHTSFFILMEKCVLEVLSIAQMMVEESEINQMQSNNKLN